MFCGGELSLCPRGAEEFELARVSLPGDESKKGASLQGLLMSSPHSPALPSKADGPSCDKVGVVGICPVKLFSDTLSTVREVWLNGGKGPSNRLELRRRTPSRSSRRISKGTGPEK